MILKDEGLSLLFHRLLCVSALIGIVQLRCGLGSFPVPPSPPLPCSCSCAAHVTTDLCASHMGLDRDGSSARAFTTADDCVSCSFTTSKNGKSHRPYPNALYRKQAQETPVQ